MHLIPLLGERLDVVIHASQKPSSYWIRVQGNDFCSSARQSAILHYKDSWRKTSSSKSSKKLFSQFADLPVGINYFDVMFRKNVNKISTINLNFFQRI